ncbi:ABC transporter permease, partial [Chlamydiia bacterium]|nr:ABC transporter permease [Chlamydiia bacterium]
MKTRYSLFIKLSLFIFAFMIMLGIYAPLLANDYPILMVYRHVVYFPLFKHLLSNTQYSKSIDLFFNCLLITSPLYMTYIFARKRPLFILSLMSTLGLFILTLTGHFETNRFNYHQPGLYKQPLSTLQIDNQAQTVELYIRNQHITSLLNLNERKQNPWDKQQQAWSNAVESEKSNKRHINVIDKNKQWLDEETSHIQFLFYPLIPFNWETFYPLSSNLQDSLPLIYKFRLTQNSLFSSLIYGTRISITVGIVAVFISLLVGIPIGALAGYIGGRFDMFTCRFIEIWECFPVFFMLLFVTSMLQTKSILIIIMLLSIFSWTGFSRYIRAEVLKQKNLPYVEAAHAAKLSNINILLFEILPNAINPIITLVPFAMMGAIGSEAGLSFLGLGENISCSWGTLMDEGRQLFPSKSYMLWPAAIMLSLFLISIAII